MSFTRVRPLGWSFGDKLASAEATQIDLNVSRAVDKTVAGDTIAGPLTWASGASIVMNNGSSQVFQSGSGLFFNTGSATFTTGSTLNMQPLSTLNFSSSRITGNAELLGSIVVSGTGFFQTSSGGRFILGDNDWPQFSSTRTRTVMCPLANLNPRLISGTISINFITIGDFLSIKDEDAFAGSIFTCNFPESSMHNGATLSSVELWFYAPTKASLPANFPGCRVFRTDLFTDLAAPTGTSALSTTATQEFPAVSLASYNGKMHKLVYSCNQNNVIDTSKYMYGILVIDESSGGAAPGNLFTHCVFTYTNIANMRFP